MRFRTFCILFLVALSFVNTTSAQSQEKLYSTLILNFARGLQWPESTHEKEFVIGVLGYQPLAIELNKIMSNTKVGGKPVRVLEFPSPDEMESCHILFIPTFKNKSLKSVLTRLGRLPTLVITNKPQSAVNGSGINLVLTEGKLRYEINCRALAARGMKISTNIKRLGIIIE